MSGLQAGTRNEDPQPDGPPENRAAQLGLGFFFGVIFGFLLQKGGVAKYEVLIGMLLLEDSRSSCGDPAALNAEVNRWKNKWDK